MLSMCIAVCEPTIQRPGSMEIGQKSEIWSADGHLGMGITFALFHSVGISPQLKLKLNIEVRQGGYGYSNQL